MIVKKKLNFFSQFNLRSTYGCWACARNNFPELNKRLKMDAMATRDRGDVSAERVFRIEYGPLNIFGQYPISSFLLIFYEKKIN